MIKHWKTSLLVLLGVFVVIQSGFTLMTLRKVNKLQAEIPAVQAVTTTSQQQKAPDEPGNVKSPIPVSIAGAPSIGPTNAPITMVEFTDFECSFCKAVQPTIKEVLKKYDGKIHFVSRNYPLSSLHADAVIAALAGMCANDQNKYWDFHDEMFENAHDSGSLTKDVLNKIASNVGLDQKKFSSCLNSKKYIDQVQKDFEDGQSYMVSGTPTFFINNRIVTGNQPIEVFEKIIDEEMEKN